MVKARSLLLLGSVVLLCLVLLTVQTRSQSSAVADLLAYLTTPVQSALSKTQRATLAVGDTYREWRDVRAENERLRRDMERLRLAALTVAETADENRRLRELLALQRRLPLATLSGEIIAREWGGWVRSLTVDRGRSDGVARLAAVISPGGLVGRVVEVRPGTSIVQVLTDPASQVSAHVVRTRTPGIVEGESRGTVRFKYMARDGAKLHVDDVVVTAGLGGVFPRGIPIGRVTAIDNRGSALFHYAALAPAVDLTRLDEVLLVMDEGRGRDLAGVFPSPGR